MSLNRGVRSAVAGSGQPPPDLDYDLIIVGGCGHVGLPLALSFGGVGCRVGIFDVDKAKIASVCAGQMPFLERGAEAQLKDVLAQGRLALSDDPEIVGRSDTVVMVIGTPIDEFMNPSTRLFERVVDQLAAQLRPGVLFILRSTVYPGTTEFVEERLAERGIRADVTFCPERIAEGNALEEIRSLPQIIGANTEAAFERASAVFEKLDVEIVRTTPREAELAKLMTNTWRYMKFAIANQFFEIGHRVGVDYNRVLHAIRHHYPRAQDVPGPGFAAGPCLLKDTMQLAAFSPDHFPMGHSAMLINEGLPAYLIDTLNHRRPLAGHTVGILGMAFKGESDDPRSSLSYKLKKLATFRGARVICTDPYIDEPGLLPVEEVLQQAEVLIIGAPHRIYRDLALDGRELVDIWGLTGRGITA
jgi:UDP-N-acetyl-D-mannosaminuronic acid dehydrogenase